MATGWGERLVRSLAAEVAPTLPRIGPDAAKYVDDLVERFRNPAMQHLLRQIGSDGSLKIAERWLDALRALRAGGAGNTDSGAGRGRVGQRHPTRRRRGSGLRHDRPRHGGARPVLAGHVRPVDPGRRHAPAQVGAADLAEQPDLTSAVAGAPPGPAGRADRDLTSSAHLTRFLLPLRRPVTRFHSNAAVAHPVHTAPRRDRPMTKAQTLNLGMWRREPPET